MAEDVSGDLPAQARRSGYVEGLYLSYLLATPTHPLLPVARRLAGRSGVRTGPYLVLPMNAGAHRLVGRFHGADGRSGRQRSVAGGPAPG